MPTVNKIYDTHERQLQTTQLLFHCAVHTHVTDSTSPFVIRNSALHKHLKVVMIIVNLVDHFLWHSILVRMASHSRALGGTRNAQAHAGRAWAYQRRGVSVRGG